LKWHINQDRTGGKPLNKQLFKTSKEYYLMRNEPVNIVGFCSGKHHGMFIGTFSPAQKGRRRRRQKQLAKRPLTAPHIRKHPGLKFSAVQPLFLSSV